jgi:DNA-binding NtrC family response regulator
MVGSLLYSHVKPAELSRMLPPAQDVNLGVRHHPDLEIRQPEPVDLFSDKDLPTLEDAERELISRALTLYEGNRRKSAEALGISERTLYRKIDQYNLDS